MSHVTRSRWFGFAMGILCTLALVAALGSVTGVWAGTLAQDAQPPDREETNGPTSPDGAVGRVIPVQGRLTDASGSPISGTRNITFTLYTAPSGGTAVCEDNDNVTVTDGLFNAEIDFCTAAEINGQALYLGIWVQGEAAEMTPRQAIRPVPYAFSLVPGAEIGGINAGSGSLYLKDTTGVKTIGLTASNGALDLGGTGNDGDLYVRSVSNTITAQINGDGGSLYLGGTGQAGDLRVRNMTNTVTFQANGSTGDVSQALAGDGLVKAAVYALCYNAGSSIYRSFNNVAGTITITDGPSVGRCTIDFGFDVSERFVVATAANMNAPRYVTYMPGSSNNSLDFYRWNDTGTGISGAIMVLIY